MTQLMLIAALVLVGAGAFAIIEIHYRKIQKEEKQRVAAMLESLEDPDYCDLDGIEVFKNTYMSTVEENENQKESICPCADDTSEDCLITRRKKTA